jgi:hypothetical protein
VSMEPQVTLRPRNGMGMTVYKRDGRASNGGASDGRASVPASRDISETPQTHTTESTGGKCPFGFSQ